jgi:ribonuclease E
VNSSGGAHARNARRLIHASRKQDRRLAAALLAAALAHTPEAEEALRGARTRMARKPPALARELLRNFPKRRARNNKRKRKAPKSVVPTRASANAGVAESVPAAKASVPGVDVPPPSTEVSRETQAVSHSRAGTVAEEETGTRSASRASRAKRAGGAKTPRARAGSKEAVESAAARVKAASEVKPVGTARSAKGVRKAGAAKRASRAAKTARTKTPEVETSEVED